MTPYIKHDTIHEIFFDTNVYIAEALIGQTAEQMIQETCNASWRIYVSTYVTDEVRRVLTDRLNFSQRLAFLTQQRILRRAILVNLPTSRHAVPDDPKDSPILQAAITSGADYLITNDEHLLSLSPYESLRIISMTAYRQLLINEGLWE
jgi:putative PIN family toxin of toxin-antitoxin system